MSREDCRDASLSGLAWRRWVRQGQAWYCTARYGSAGFGVEAIGLFINSQGISMKFQFSLKGITPLLVHADDVEASDRLRIWREDPENKNISKKGDDRSPPWTWQSYLYTDGTHLTIPGDNLSACLLNAAAMMILKGKTTYKQVSQSGLFIHEDQFPILDADSKPYLAKDIEAIGEAPFPEQVSGVESLGFSLFTKRAKPQGSSGKHVRVRPRFDRWEIRGTVEITCKEITEQSLRQMFEIAGTYKGLGDWRPSSPNKPGRFGRFEATLTKV